MKRFIVPVLAIGSSIFMMAATVYAHGIQPYLPVKEEGAFSCPVLFYLIVFAVIMLIGLLCNAKHKNSERPFFKFVAKKWKNTSKRRNK